MRIILFIVSMLLVLQASAQRKFHFDIDYQYSLGIYEYNKFYTCSRNEYNMSGHAIHLSGRYDITPKISTGLGIGVDAWLDPDRGMFPVYATVRYKPLTHVRGFYTFADLGCGFMPKAWTVDGMFMGGIGNIGTGYTLYISKNFGLNFKVGYGILGARGKAYFYEPQYNENLDEGLDLS